MLRAAWIFFCLAMVALIFLLNGCAATKQPEIKRTISTKTFRVYGPPVLVDRLLEACDIDKINTKVARLLGLEKKFLVFNILSERDFRSKFNRISRKSDACYLNGVIYISSWIINNRFDLLWTVYHEVDHAYPESTEYTASYTACLYTDDSRCKGIF